MKKYISNINNYVNTPFGPFAFSVGNEVPEHIAEHFLHYVSIIGEEIVPVNLMEDVEETNTEIQPTLFDEPQIEVQQVETKVEVEAEQVEDNVEETNTEVQPALFDETEETKQPVETNKSIKNKFKNFLGKNKQ